MNHLVSITSELNKEVNRINCDGEDEYLLIEEFGDSSVKTETIYKHHFFRLFTPVKPEKNRKLNTLYTPKTPFEPLMDSLMDYPTIINSKLNDAEDESWSKYNHLLSLHTARCPLNCWHCYLEECLRNNCNNCAKNSICDQTEKRSLGIQEGWFTAKRIVTSFLQERDLDISLSTNVLRVTGGEPFLTPKLILELLAIIRLAGLEHQVFLWTETNLIPFIKLDGIAPIIDDQILAELSTYKNFCIHPCFHGLSKGNFNIITGSEVNDFQDILKAFRRIVAAGIDVYPTFGSNVSNIEEIDVFFAEIFKINHNLPLRFSLIDYYLQYQPIIERKEMPRSFQNLINRGGKIEILERWDKLLEVNCGSHYGIIPRHQVDIKS